MKIAIANDHKGYLLKEKLKKYLIKKGYEILDLGTDSTTSVDYPEYGFELGKKIIDNEADFGIAICGTGIGISIACNKVKGIRCAKPINANEARLSREHNDANVLALSSSVSYFKNLDILDSFLKAKFTGLERHQRRIDKITEFENQKPKKRTRKKVENQDEC